MNGTISSVEDHGSIVIVWVNMDDGTSQPVYMERRAFGRMVEGEGIARADELEGRVVAFDGGTIEFLDTLEIA